MSNGVIRVTQVVFDLNGGGMESLVAAMALRWRATPVVLSIVTLSGRAGHVGEMVRKLVDRFEVLRLARGLSMIAPTTLVRAIRRTNPDVVHLHTGAWFKGAHAARLARVPRVVYTEHGREHHDPLLARLQDRVASRWTHRVVAVSPRLERYLASAVGVPPERIVTIPNGIDTAAFAPGAAGTAIRDALRVPADALVIGSVGRLEPVKAYARLVAAYAELRRLPLGRPLVLVIFGDGSDRAAIEREADRLGVRDGVRLPGWTDDVPSAYRLLDIFAMTSRSEGMSISLMEAMACGVTPLVTDVGANAEVLGPALAHHAIAERDSAAFVKRAHDLLSDPHARATAGAAARRQAARTFSLACTLAAYERLYRGDAAPAA